MDDDAEDIERYARATLEGLPDPYRAMSADVLLRIQDMPDADMLQEMGIADPLELTGLYDGIPHTRKSVVEPQLEPDMVWLFVRPILAEWRARRNVTLQELVAHVTVHEIAHHFGWSDDDIAAIDRWWE